MRVPYRGVSRCRPCCFEVTEWVANGDGPKVMTGLVDRQCRSCGVGFTPSGPNSQFCPDHTSVRRKPHRSGNKIYGRLCVVCGGIIPAAKNKNAKVCSKRCTAKRGNDATKERKRIAALEENEEDRRSRKGEVYRTIDGNGMAAQISSGDVKAATVAELLGVTKAAVSRAMVAWELDQVRNVRDAAWVMEPDVEALFPVDLFDELADVGLDAEGTEEFEVLMFRLEFSFWQFESRYFTIGSKQAKFIVEEFHVEIVREFIIAQVFATRVLVLTPPRHGKSEMVLRFVAWLIIMFPNIQILWVAANSKLAVAMTGKLKGVFEFTEKLIEETLPKGRSYGDSRAPRWTESEFTLYTRTDRTLKSSTFTAIGSSATVAGRDADFIGIDDLEERKTVGTLDQRQKSKEKHAEIMERQENETGVVTIASRQHPDDIANTLMQQTQDAMWRVSEYPAHDEACTLDDDVVEGHDANGCVLMPSIRNYGWLLRMKRETDALGLPGRYELRYLQKSIPVDGMIFDIALIRERCLDRSRMIGEIDLDNVDYRLIAGMDPAPRGYQAAVLWAWTPEVTYLIDIETTRGKGQLGAIQLFEDWYLKYGLDHWVYEDNMAKQDFFTRPDLIKVKAKYDLTIESHTTGNNKKDPEMGISSMAPWYHGGRFILPYGNSESVLKTKMLLAQLQLWTTDGLVRGATVTDIKMASWFPFVRRLQKWDRSTRSTDLEMVSDQSYPGLDGNQPEWGLTEYGVYGGSG